MAWVFSIGTILALSDAVYITKKSGTGFTFTIPDKDGYYVVTRTNGTLPPNGTASNVLEQIFYVHGTDYYFFGQHYIYQNNHFQFPYYFDS